MRHDWWVSDVLNWYWLVLITNLLQGGLCHDLGHGPFSHLFEQFVQEARGVKWSHKQTSLDLLDLIMEENDLMPVFQRYGLTDIDIIFIKVITDHSSSRVRVIITF